MPPKAPIIQNTSTIDMISLSHRQAIMAMRKGVAFKTTKKMLRGRNFAAKTIDRKAMVPLRHLIKSIHLLYSPSPLSTIKLSLEMETKIDEAAKL